MFVLPQLKFNKNDLNPHISENTLNFHYGKHHAGYVSKLNAALEGHDDLLYMNLEELLKNVNQTPTELHKAILNNGGQHYNHSLYWESMSGDGGGEPTGALLDAINEAFGSFAEFKTQFSNAGATQFGSGWAWLSVDSDGNLVIDQTLNADTPLLHSKKPILTMDVWEHAYYLDYQNARAEYINHFFDVIDWKEVSNKYIAAQ